AGRCRAGARRDHRGAESAVTGRAPPGVSATHLPMTVQHAVLKENQTFLVTDPAGDVVARANDGQGLYYRDTRCLSQYELLIGDAPPQLLSATGEFNFITNLQLANPVMSDDDGQALAPRTVSIRRNRFLHHGLHERV